MNTAIPDIDSIPLPSLHSLGITLAVMRLDKLNQIMSGNKLFKLHQNIEYARDKSLDTLISFGGAYSNHIHALAMAGKYYGINTVGIIRGEMPANLSDTLKDAKANGMHLEFVSRSDYRKKNEPDYIDSLRLRWPQAHIIPEGGSNALGVQGCEAIVSLLDSQLGDAYDVVALACGTGATLAGVSSAIQPGKRVIGFSVLKEGEFLKESISDFQQAATHGIQANWNLCTDYHFGGYAKVTPELISFMQRMYGEYQLPLDAVYTAKALFGLIRNAERGVFPRGSRLIFIHTGGLQGNRGFVEKYPEIEFTQPELMV